MAFLGHVATRIINEVKGVNRVVYDVTEPAHYSIDCADNSRGPRTPTFQLSHAQVK
jgi:hypothetical protein